MVQYDSEKSGYPKKRFLDLSNDLTLLRFVITTINVIRNTLTSWRFPKAKYSAIHFPFLLCSNSKRFWQSLSPRSHSHVLEQIGNSDEPINPEDCALCWTTFSHPSLSLRMCTQYQPLAQKLTKWTL